MEKVLKYWDVLILMISFVFGYGALNERVKTLEKQVDYNQSLVQDVVRIREDVSYIKGKLEKR
jgi:hypothetical protein